MANKEFIARNGLIVTGDANLTGNLVVSGNNIVSSIKAAYDAANAAGSGATVSAGFEAANAAFNTANSAYTSSNSAFGQANTANLLAFRANVNAIAAFVAANAAFNKANAGSNVTFTQFVIKGGGNLTIVYANSNSSSFNIETGNGITYANTANGLNLGLTTTGVTAAYYGGSSAIPVIQIDQFGRITTASNVSINQAAASAAFDAANAAYINANTKLATSGGTITGDLSVAGNLFVTGNTTFITANTLRVTDPLLYLAGNNYSSDLVDIGFIANYVNSTGANVHTGLYREHENKMYYLFNGYDVEPINNHIGAFSNNMTLAVLNADLITSNLWLGGQNTINWINAAFTRANASATAVNGTIIIDNTVGNQKLANVSQGTVKGRANNAGQGEVQDLSYSDFINQMPLFSNTINGVVPKTVTWSSRFLRDDGTWIYINPTLVNTVFDFANTSNLLAFRANVNAAAAFAQVNVAVANVNYVNTAMQAAFNVANIATANVNFVNTAMQSAFATLNIAIANINFTNTEASAAFAQANIANTTAIAAFNKANISSAGGISLNAQNTAPAGVANNLWFNTDTGELYVYHTDWDGTSQWVQINGNGAGITSLRNVDYNLMFFSPGQVDANVVMYLNLTTTNYSLPANLTGSYARVITAPTGNNANLRILKNDTYIGNVAFARNNTNGTFVFANTVTFTPGDVLRILSPVSIDTTMSDIAVSLLGSKIN